MNKDDKKKAELEIKENEEDNNEEEYKNLRNKKVNYNSANKNALFKTAVKKIVKFRSDSPSGVDLNASVKKAAEFNVKKNGLGKTNSNGKINKKK